MLCCKALFLNSYLVSPQTLKITTRGGCHYAERGKRSQFMHHHHPASTLQIRTTTGPFRHHETFTLSPLITVPKEAFWLGSWLSLA